MSLTGNASEDRFSAVSSFYGPGTATAWLCTLSSIFITWCFNAEHSHKDNFGLDFVVAVAIPAISSVHALYQIFSPPNTSPNDPQVPPGAQQSWSLFISQDPDTLRRAAAIEAALTICETFSAAAVVLVFIAMFRGHVKRMLVTVAAGLLAFIPTVAVFIMTRGLQISQSNLSRPFLFNSLEVMLAVFIFLLVWGTTIFVILVIMPGLQHSSFTASSQLEQLVVIADFTPRRLRSIEETFVDADEEDASDGLTGAGRDIRCLTLVSMLILPFTFCSTTFGATGLFGSTSYMVAQQWLPRLLFFIPNSATRITELDQMVSACTGVIALVWSLWDAFHSQKKVEDARQFD
ncbi:hypothetical protein CC79DRAFT_1400475 [Sarocladium strictum]